MRTDIAEIPLAEMTQLQRALLAYEGNHALDSGCPMAGIAKVQADTPVIRWEMGVALFSMADIVAAGNHPALVSADPNTGEAYGMGSAEPLLPLHIDGELHRHYRKLLDPLLAPRRVAAYEAAFRALTDEIIDGFIDDGQVDLYSQFAAVVPTTMFFKLFGAPLEDFDFFVEMKDRILQTDGPLEEREQTGRQYGARMHDRLRSVLDQRRADGVERDDLIGTFMNFEMDGHRLSDDEIVNIMHLFTIAGLDTVTSTISLILARLAQHPEERRRVMADPSMVPAVVEELMRYESPVPSGGLRWATEDIEINGIPVKAGEMIYLCWASGNLDPAIFDHPLTVDYDRESNRHIGFAAGRHRCLGSHLARLELRCAIDQWHKRVADYEVTPGAEPRFAFNGVRACEYLPVTFTTR